MFAVIFRNDGRRAVPQAATRSWRQTILFGVAALLFALPVRATPPQRGLKDMYHKSWTVKDGVPPGILSLAQTTDGFLWLGTTSGLYQFDGVSFEHFQPKTGQKVARTNVFSLYATPDGGLWIGYSLGGVAFLKDGQITNYLQQDGRNMDAATAFLRDDQGGMWKCDNDGTLAHFDGKQWKAVRADWSFKGDAAALSLDHKGTLWVDQPDGLSCLPRGEHQFTKIVPHTKPPVQNAHWDTPSPPDLEWLHSVNGPYQLACSANQSLGYQFTKWPVSAERGFEDSDGSSWIKLRGAGVGRQKQWLMQAGSDPLKPVSFPIESFTKQDGLTNDFVRAITKDKEGNVWVGTNGGLDMFHPAAVGTIHFPADAQGFNLLPAADGSLWVPMLLGKDNLVKIVDGKVMSMTKKFRSFQGIVQSYISPKGVIWMGSYPNEILKLEHDKIETVDTYSSPSRPYTEDGQGRLWAIIGSKGVIRRDNGVWSTTLKSLGGEQLPVLSGFTDTLGRVWFGSFDAVKMLDGTKVTVYKKNEGVTAGDVVAVHGRDGRVWIAGAGGLNYFDGKRFQPVVPFDQASFTGVKEFLDTASDGIWMSENRGIINIPAAEVRTFLKDPTHRVTFRIFDYLDGLPGSPQIRPMPSMAEGADGILWFATTEGLAWIDPKKISTNLAVPTVLIRSLKSGSQIYDQAALNGLRLPARTTALQLTYTALSLAIPERTKFRYQLEGVDPVWQDAGTRRQAFYTNLGPGTYRFRVVACNDEGVWNNTGATISFSILPAFYQTWWFRFLYIVAACGTIWLLCLIRLKQVTAQVQLRLGARLEERERIARELHDTLLQSVQALMLRFQAVMKTLPNSEPAHQMMGKALDRADEVLLEGRQRVRDLRAEAVIGSDLPNRLAKCAEELSLEHPAEFTLSVKGIARVLDSSVASEAYRIGREALTNAFQHAGARQINAEVDFGPKDFRLVIRDDGKGLDRDLQEKGRPGHWGLAGMRERADKLGARFSIWSQIDRGTAITLVVPNKIAYPRDDARWISKTLNMARRTKSR